MSFEYREKSVYELVNRLINIVVATLGLVCLGPLMLTIAAAIKLSNRKAPIFYRGTRVGRHGKPYMILKFRTMIPQAETQIGAQLVRRESPYITRLGRLLRRRKFDELPQLLNVLRGDMNVVGPRPAREVFLPELRGRIPNYDRRFLVRPGITGLAQVNGGYYTDPRNKLRYELIYIRRRSVWLDIKLVAATLFIMASRTLTMFGLLVTFLAFVVFVPTTFLPMLHVNVLGMPVNVAFLLIAGLATAWVSRSVLGGPLVLRRTPSDSYIVLFILWMILGAVSNPGIGRNLLGVLYAGSSAFVLYFLASQDVRPDTTRVQRHVRFLGAISGIVSLWGIAEYLVQRQGSTGVRVASLLGNTSVLAVYLTMMLPILLYLAMYDDRGNLRVVWRGAAFLVVGCLVLTFSWAGYIAASSAVLVWFYARHRSRAWFALAIGVLVLVTIELVDGEGLTLQSRIVGPHATRTVRMFSEVVDGFHDDLLVGVSWRNWKDTLEPVSASTLSSDDALGVGIVVRPNRLRNMYLTWLVEYGVVGLLLILLIFATILRTLYQGARRIPDRAIGGLVWAILAGELGAMVYMLFFDAAYFIAVQTTFWLLAGFGVGLSITFGGGAGRQYRWTEAKLLAEVRPGQWKPRTVWPSEGDGGIVGLSENTQRDNSVRVRRRSPGGIS